MSNTTEELISEILMPTLENNALRKEKMKSNILRDWVENDVFTRDTLSVAFDSYFANPTNESYLFDYFYIYTAATGQVIPFFQETNRTILNSAFRNGDFINYMYDAYQNTFVKNNAFCPTYVKVFLRFLFTCLYCLYCKVYLQQPELPHDDEDKVKPTELTYNIIDNFFKSFSNEMLTDITESGDIYTDKDILELLNAIGQSMSVRSIEDGERIREYDELSETDPITPKKRSQTAEEFMPSDTIGKNYDAADGGLTRIRDSGDMSHRDLSTVTTPGYSYLENARVEAQRDPFDDEYTFQGNGGSRQSPSQKQKLQEQAGSGVAYGLETTESNIVSSEEEFDSVDYTHLNMLPNRSNTQQQRFNINNNKCIVAETKYDAEEDSRTGNISQSSEGTNAKFLEIQIPNLRNKECHNDIQRKRTTQVRTKNKSHSVKKRKEEQSYKQRLRKRPTKIVQVYNKLVSSSSSSSSSSDEDF